MRYLKWFSILFSITLFLLCYVHESGKSVFESPVIYKGRTEESPDRTDYGGYILKRQRFFLQQQDNTCGPASLRYLLFSVGRKVTEKEIAEEMKAREQGSSFLDIKRTASKYGLQLTGVKADLEFLHKRSPAIIQLSFGHFVVYLHQSSYGRHVYIFDPLYGYVFIKNRTFRKVWTGYALVTGKDM